MTQQSRTVIINISIYVTALSFSVVVTSRPLWAASSLIILNCKYDILKKAFGYSAITLSDENIVKARL